MVRRSSSTPPARAPAPKDTPWVPVDGRSVDLPGLRRPSTGVLRWLAILGPGVITGAAANDAGAIATYASAGAKFGFDLLWVLVLVTIALSLIQETAARLGAATGRGLLDLIRERFGIGWGLLAVTVVLVANGSLVVAEFSGIAAASELLGISRFIAVPAAALLIGYLVAAGSYRRVEKVFLVMALVFLAYPIGAVLAHPHWSAVARGAFVPRLLPNRDYLLLLVSMLGSGLTPYQQIFQQSSIVERGVARRHYGPERIDTVGGMLFATTISAFIVIATGATLHASGHTEIATAADAAQALQPVAGNAAVSLFAMGLLGAALLAAAVLPLATAYAVSEVFGFRKGINVDFRRARIFRGIFGVLLAVGAVAALFPALPVISLMVAAQVLNGVLLPVMLFFLLMLINDDRLAGSLRNGLWSNILSWTAWGGVTVAVAVFLGSQLLGS